MRYNILDVLRFIAALCVVLYHYFTVGAYDTFGSIVEVTKFGYLGVPLFFIISGFVIFASASGRKAREFAVSRFIRLYPTYWICLAITSLTLLFSGYSIDFVQIVANVTMLNNYFDIDSVDGVYWTLHLELKFYLCIFFLCLFGWLERYRIWLTIWTVFAVCYAIFSQPFFMGWFISPHYSSLFISGILFYLINRKGIDLHSLLLLSMSFILSCYWAYQIAPDFVQSATVQDQFIAMLVTALIHVMFLLIALGVIKLGDHRWLLAVGGLTYPLYLLHNTAGKVIISELSDPLGRYGATLIALAVALLLSAAIFYFFEKRSLTALKRKLLSPR